MLWLSAQEIADAAASGLMPDLPTTERSIRRLADRENWAKSKLARIRRGRIGGGGAEYHVDLLPRGSRLVWLAHHLSLEASELRPPLMDGPISATEDARAVLLKLADRFKSTSKLPQTAADALFCEVFNSGSIELQDWLQQAVSTLSARTLARWRKAARCGNDFVPCGRPKGSGVLDRAHDGAVRDLVIAAIANQPFLKAKHCRALVRDRFGDQLELLDDKTGEIREVALPSVRMFQFAIKAWKETYRNELIRITDPDGYRSKIEFTATGSQRAERLNEVWQIDASPADVMLTGGRHSIYMAVDVYSRRSIVLATPTPRASGVGLLIRKCLLEWGVPEKIHTDNGSDFVARQTKRLFSALDIEVELSPPYQPKSKGIVERTIGTFQRDLATCPGFVGHSVADRKVIEGRKAFSRRLGASDAELFDVTMDLHVFQDWCDAWSTKIYGHDTHAGIGGLTPFAMAASYAGPVRHIEHQAALDVLLAPIASGDGLRRVGKQGVRVAGASYLPMGVMPGTDVLVRMDPADLGRVLLFNPETEAFLGEAICPELAGLPPAEVVAKAKAIQKAHEADQLVDIRRTMRRLKPYDVANALRREGERRADVMMAFPERKEAFSNAALDAAKEASGPAQPRETNSSVSPEKHAAFVANFKSRTKTEPPKETAKDRFLRARGFEQQLERGEPLNDADHAWLNVYQNGPEYRSQAMMFAKFGDRMFAG